MCGKRFSRTAVVRIGLALSMLAAIPASAQVTRPPVAVASGGASAGIPAYAGIAVAAGAVSVIGYAAYVSITRHRELMSREAMTAIFLPFIGPLLLEVSVGDLGAPFMPGGATVSSAISGLSQLKDSAGSATSNGTGPKKRRGRGGGVGSVSGG
jgi:hypothetical protein